MCPVCSISVCIWYFLNLAKVDCLISPDAGTALNDQSCFSLFYQRYDFSKFAKKYRTPAWRFRSPWSNAFVFHLISSTQLQWQVKLNLIGWFLKLQTSLHISFFSYHLRVIVWNTAEVPPSETSVTGEEMSDLYLKGWLEGMEDDKEKTDVHYRSMDGEVSISCDSPFVSIVQSCDGYYKSTSLTVRNA